MAAHDEIASRRPSPASPDVTRAAIDHVKQLADRYRWRPFDVGALVAPGVGDDEAVGHGHQGVEQKLAVLAAGVAVADVRVVQDEVVAVARRFAGKDAIVEPEQANDPVRHGAHRYQGADGEMAGSEVGHRRPALEAVGEQGTNVGEGQGCLVRAVPCRRIAAVAAPSAGSRAAPPADASLCTSSRIRCSWARCQLSRSDTAVIASAAAAIDRTQASTGLARHAGRRARRAADRSARRTGRPGRWPHCRHRRGEGRRRRDGGPPRPWPRRAGPGPIPPARCWPRAGRACRATGEGASIPQRTPVAATHSSTRARSSSSIRKRRRTGSRPARSSTSAAVRRAVASSSSSETTPRTGLVWRRDRSASLTRRSGGRAAAATAPSWSSSPSPAPNVAWMSGANVSMSGHITIMSRASRVGSSARRCRMASRTTST